MAEEKKAKGILAVAAETLGAVAGSVAAIVSPVVGSPAAEKTPGEKPAPEKAPVDKGAPEKAVPEKAAPEQADVKATVKAPKNERIPKLASKNKTRLPRKEKKALKAKAALAEAKS